MSRVAKNPIVLPQGVEVLLEGGSISIKGPLGATTFPACDSVTVEKVENYGQIAAYNIMSTPGLVINGQVVSAGRVLTAHSIKELILRAVA